MNKARITNHSKATRVEARAPLSSNVKRIPRFIMKIFSFIQHITLFMSFASVSYADCPEGEVRFSFENLNITNAFAILSDASGLTVLIDRPINYSEPMNFDCTPWQKVANNLAKKYDLSINSVNETMYVSKTDSLKEDLILIFTGYNGGGTLYVVDSSIKRNGDNIEFDYILDVYLAYEKLGAPERYKSNKVHSVINCRDDTYAFRGLEAYAERAGYGNRTANYYGTREERKTKKIEKRSSTRDIYNYLCLQK